MRPLSRIAVAFALLPFVFPVVRPAYAACSTAPTASVNDALVRFKNPAAYAQVTGIATPDQGDLVYDSTNNVFKLCDGTNWNALGGPAGSAGYIQFNSAGNFGADSALYWDNANKYFAIGATAPTVPLHVVMRVMVESW